MSDKKRRLPERVSDIREAIGNIVLTHEYFRVDAAVVWDTVRTDLPRLDAMLDRLASV